MIFFFFSPSFSFLIIRDLQSTGGDRRLSLLVVRKMANSSSKQVKRAKLDEDDGPASSYRSSRSSMATIRKLHYSIWFSFP